MGASFGRAALGGKVVCWGKAWQSVNRESEQFVKFKKDLINVFVETETDQTSPFPPPNTRGSITKGKGRFWDS